MERITVQTTVEKPLERVWDSYNNPEHIVHWAFASDDWCAPRAENDLRTGGRFLTRMEAKDASAGFDFTGIYDEVEPMKKISYTMSDGRSAEIIFEAAGNGTSLHVSFDPENENPAEMQREGWQAILDNFKKYTERLQ